MGTIDLQGQVAVVTGASLGIGRATALALGEAGAQVVVNYRSHPEQAEEVVKTIQAAGSEAIKVQGRCGGPGSSGRSWWQQQLLSLVS